MSISPLTAVGATTPAAQTKPSPQEASKSFSAELTKLAVSPSDTVTLSAQAQSLMHNQGMGAALSILGN